MKTRDKFGSYEHFDSRVVDDQEYFGERKLQYYIDKFLADERVLESGHKDLSFLSGVSLSSEAEFIPVRYSRGDLLDDIVSDHLDELLARYEYLAIELSKGHPAEFIYGYPGQKTPVTRLHSVYTFLAWTICFGAAPQKLSSIVPYLDSAGFDRLLDVVTGFYQPGRKVATECAYPKAFGLLFDVTNADENQRANLIKRHLDDWPKCVDVIGAHTLGVKCSNGFKKITSVDDLLSGIDGGYEGYWSWEAALAVKFFHIDDSSFKDHDFYPYDLVHHAPPLDNLDYLASLGSGSLTSAGVGGTTGQNFDLTVTDNLDVEAVSAFLQPGSNVSNREQVYSAHKLNPSQAGESSIDIVEGSAMRYSAYILTAQDEVDESAGRVAYSMSIDAEFSPRHESMSMHQLIDEQGQSEFLPFMEEVHLYISGDKSECEYVYCSRHKEAVVPPLMILRYRKAKAGVVFCIDCMVRDEEFKVSDVWGHWQWLIDRYHEIV